MKKSRIVSRELANALAKRRGNGGDTVAPTVSLPEYVERDETPSESLYKVIEDESMWGNRFTDNFYGIPWIELSDIEDKGNGLFIVRFRCPPEYMHHVYFGKMAEDVCDRVGSGMHFFHQTKVEQYSEHVKLPYEDCVWVIQCAEEKFDGEK